MRPDFPPCPAHLTECDICGARQDPKWFSYIDGENVCTDCHPIEKDRPMHTCPACDGLRTYAKTVPNVRKSNGVEYVSTIQPTKTLLYPCATCGGSGKVNCRRCSDTGYYEEYDYATGEYSPGLYHCDCNAGMRMAELDRIDAEKAAHDATHPDYIELAHANAAAGLDPF